MMTKLIRPLLSATAFIASIGTAFAAAGEEDIFNGERMPYSIPMPRLQEMSCSQGEGNMDDKLAQLRKDWWELGAEFDKLAVAVDPFMLPPPAKLNSATSHASTSDGVMDMDIDNEERSKITPPPGFGYEKSGRSIKRSTPLKRSEGTLNGIYPSIAHKTLPDEDRYLLNPFYQIGMNNEAIKARLAFSLKIQAVSLKSENVDAFVKNHKRGDRDPAKITKDVAIALVLLMKGINVTDIQSSKDVYDIFKQHKMTSLLKDLGYDYIYSPF